VSSSFLPRRTRTSRTAGLNLPPNSLARAWDSVRRPEVLVRVGLFLLAVFLLWLITGMGVPPFAFRAGDVPRRKIIARATFQVKDEAETQKRIQEARRTAETVYENHPALLAEVRQRLTLKVSELVQSESFDKLDMNLWREFSPLQPSRPELEEKQRFEALRTYFTAGMDANRFGEAVKKALAPMETIGLLKQLKHTLDRGSAVSLLVYQEGNERHKTHARVDDVLMDKAKKPLRQRLEDEFKVQMSMADNAVIVSELAYHWLETRLPETLTWNQKASDEESTRVEGDVEPVMLEYKAGVAELAPGGKPLSDDAIDRLRREHAAWVATFGWDDRLARSLAMVGMYLGLAILCGFYVYHRRPELLTDFRRYATLLSAIVVTMGLGTVLSDGTWRAELIPLLLFGMTAAIAYEKELALLLAAALALAMSFSLDQGLAQFVILVSSVAAAILMLRRIRSRTKLIYVGAFAGLVVMLTTFGVGTLMGQAFGATGQALTWTNQHLTTLRESFFLSLAMGAVWSGFCALMAGVFMTGLLPFIERVFDVQTDISLLELGDVQHPLLQELVRRAPGTYNHSINVASIAETAADAIGANGLLVRVGAYFHDIGKMLKPSYFVENQGPEGNRHETLQPAMSTLVIIAHVKDGADLARQHRLPQSIIDFIEQHHGTTLVEYFYRREAQRLKDDPDAGELDETTFRYPGPKPQTKEAGVLMLADVVESASRALIDPTPARIESLVHDLAMKRLLDGQFDECGLTLSELKIIEDSLVKSLTAVYHGRVKYPEHQTV